MCIQFFLVPAVGGKMFSGLTSAAFAPHVCFAYTVQSVRAHFHPAVADLPQGNKSAQRGHEGFGTVCQGIHLRWTRYLLIVSQSVNICVKVM